MCIPEVNTMREIRSAVVTGATGVIGAALCRLLVTRGITVYAVVRPGSRKRILLPEHALLHTAECDLDALAGLEAQIGHADAFFHLGWKHTESRERDNMKAQLENIRTALDAAESAARLGCRVFLGAGSQAEYGLHDAALTTQTPCFPVTGYGMAKHCAGIMVRSRCRQLGLDCIWMRILSVYGDYQGKGSMISDLIDKLLAGEEPRLTEGRQICDYLYCDDAADAFLAAAQSGTADAVYVLGSGEARPLRDYVCMLRDAVDPALPVEFGAVPYSPGQVMHLEADISALTRDTGFVPHISFAEGIRRTVEARKKRRQTEYADL